MKKFDKASWKDFTRREFLGGLGAAALGLMGLSARGGRGGIFGGLANAATQGAGKTKSAVGKPVFGSRT